MLWDKLALGALCQSRGFPFIIRSYSNACITTTQKRSTFPRMYRTLLVRPDGSTVTIRYKEPVKMIKMPIDVTVLSDAERTKLWLSRQEKVVDSFDDDIQDDFKVNEYKHLWN